MRDAVIVSAVRTPVGRGVKGTLANTRPDDLAALVMNEAVKRAGVSADLVEDVYLGCAIPEAEQGLNVARLAALRAGMPDSVGGVTVNRFCSSGLNTIALAANHVMTGQGDVFVAGGLESISLTQNEHANKYRLRGEWLMEHKPDIYMSMLETAEVVAKRYGISPTTVQKWRSRQTSTDARMGPKELHSTVLSVEDEAVIVAFRRHTLLPLDDCLYALQPSLPHLTRSSLHRCLQRHGISRLPDIDGDKPKRSRFKAYPIGYFHVDIAQVSTEQGQLYLFVAIDRTSKFAFVQLHGRATQRIAAAFLHDLVAAVPYTIHTVLTDNGIPFTNHAHHKNRL